MTLKFMAALPAELYVQIWLKLPYADIIRSRRVSHFFQDLIMAPSFWREKCRHDFPNPSFPPLISSRPHDVYLEFVSRHDVTMGSEKFKSWEKCLGRAIDKGHLKLVQHFWSFNCYYLQASKPFIARPYYRPTKWVLQAASHGYRDIVMFLLPQMMPYQEGEFIQLIAAATVNHDSALLDFLKDQAEWAPLGLRLIQSSQSSDELINHGTVLGLVEANDPTRFSEVSQKIWRRYAKSILAEGGYYRLHKRRHSLDYLNSLVPPKHQWQPNQWQRVDAGDSEAIAQIEARAVDWELESLLRYMAQHGRCDIIQRLLPHMSPDHIEIAFEDACYENQRVVVELLLPHIHYVGPAAIHSLLGADYIDLAYRIVERQSLTIAQQMAICYEVTRSLHKDFIGYVLSKYQPDSGYLISLYSIDSCVRLTPRAPDGHYSYIISNYALHYSTTDEIIRFYFYHPEIPWDVAFSLEPDRILTYDELIEWLRYKFRDFTTIRKIRQVIDDIRYDHEYDRPVKRRKMKS